MFWWIKVLFLIFISILVVYFYLCVCVVYVCVAAGVMCCCRPCGIRKFTENKIGIVWCVYVTSFSMETKQRFPFLQSLSKIEEC
jgi:hypothetical protein